MDFQPVEKIHTRPNSVQNMEGRVSRSAVDAAYEGVAPFSSIVVATLIMIFVVHVRFNILFELITAL